MIKILIIKIDMFTNIKNIIFNRISLRFIASSYYNIIKMEHIKCSICNCENCNVTFKYTHKWKCVYGHVQYGPGVVLEVCNTFNKECVERNDTRYLNETCQHDNWYMVPFTNDDDKSFLQKPLGITSYYPTN